MFGVAVDQPLVSLRPFIGLDDCESGTSQQFRTTHRGSGGDLVQSRHQIVVELAGDSLEHHRFLVELMERGAVDWKAIAAWLRENVDWEPGAVVGERHSRSLRVKSWPRQTPD
jgi:hypothetical protein